MFEEEHEGPQRSTVVTAIEGRLGAHFFKKCRATCTTLKIGTY